MPSTTLLTPINAPLISLKVLIQNERTRWLRMELYAVRLYRVLRELDTLLPFFYYELLLVDRVTLSYTSCMYGYLACVCDEGLH